MLLLLFQTQIFLDMNMQDVFVIRLQKNGPKQVFYILVDRAYKNVYSQLNIKLLCFSNKTLVCNY